MGTYKFYNGVSVVEVTSVCVGIQGHRALLIFPLATLLTFCQIIRELDLIKF